MGNTDKLAGLVTDCRKMDIEMLPPHINASEWEFRPENGAIRYGLGAIKGVGEAAMRAVVQERIQNGVFNDFEALIMRAPPRTLNKRILEASIKAGALNGLIPHQNAALEGLSVTLEALGRKKKEFASNQSALFEMAEPASNQGFPLTQVWSAGEILQAERDVLGFYLTGHPLEAYLNRTTGLSDCNLSQLSDREDGAQIVVAVGVSSIRPYTGGRGTMAFVQLEDLHGQAEMVVFADLYSEASELLAGDAPLLAAVRVDKSRGDEPTLVAEAIVAVEFILPALVSEIQISASSIAWDEVTLARLKTSIQTEDSASKARLSFHVRLPDASLAILRTGPCITWNDEVKAQLDARFAPESVHLHCKGWQPPRKQQAKRGNWSSK